MGRRKKPSQYYSFESRATLQEDRNGCWKHKYVDGGKLKTDTTTNLCYSLLTSAAFLDLTARQRMLYVIAKSQFYGAVSRPGTDYPDIDLYQLYNKRAHFYLNHALVSDVFHLYPKSEHRSFYKDVQALETHGFIRRVTNLEGKNISETNKQRTIFQYSDEWKKWEPDAK